MFRINLKPVCYVLLSIYTNFHLCSGIGDATIPPIVGELSAQFRGVTGGEELLHWQEALGHKHCTLLRSEKCNG
jgi:hypothetical protein